MKNIRIEGQISKTINLGNYESAKIQVGISYDIEEPKKLKSEYKRMFSKLKEELETYIEEIEE